MQPNLLQLRSEVEAGRLSRYHLLEEIERHLERGSDAPPEGALQLVLEQLHKSPADPQALRLLARLYERDGHPEAARRALEHLDRSSRLSDEEVVADSLEDRLAVARVLLEAGHPEQAERIAREAIAAEPNSLSALNLLAKICHVEGRLSETIRLWHRIRFLAPHREGALAQLGFLQRVSQDESASQSFMLVGQDAFARKHPAQMELEAAFARFRERNFRAAIAASDSCATHWRLKSPPLYKLAVLQKAWFQERSDDLAGARATLEQLGRERGFEADVDRIAFLARVCERIGTKDALKQAQHIYEHLNVHHGKLSALPRLAGLARATGDPEAAARYDREYQRRFARRMQTPTTSDVVRALAIQYLPLAEARAPYAGPEDRAALDRDIRLVPSVAGRQRRRALAAFVTGDLAGAERRLRRLTRSRWATARDFGYLGDLLAAQGSTSRAHQAYLVGVQQASAPTVALWRQLLAGVRQGLCAEPIQRLLGDRELGARVRDALLASARASHAEPEAWYDLATFEQLAGMDAEAQAHHAKADALIRAVEATADVGRVLVAAVYTLDGKSKGLVHELLATRRPVAPGTGGFLDPAGGVVGNVTEDLRSTAVAALATTRDFVRGHWPHLGADVDDYVYTLKLAKEDEPSRGSSAGLPLAIAFISVMTGREVPIDLCFSGALVCDSRMEVELRRIGEALYKVKGAYHRNLAGVVLPEENRSDIEQGDVVPLPIARSMVRYARDLAQAVEAVWGAEAWEW